MSIKSNLFLLLSLLVIMTLVVACGSPAEPAPQDSPQDTAVADDESAYPITVESCGEAFRYPAAPARALVFDVNLIELMVTLGLTEHLAGYWTSGSDLRPELQAALAEVPEIEADWPGPSLEVIVGLEPEVVVGGWGYGFSEENGVTPTTLSQVGINSYAIRESCADTPAITIADTYADIQNIGRIFGIAAEAQAVVDGMQADVSAVTDRLDPDVDRPRVFLYDDLGGGSPYSVGGEGLVNDLMTLAGGENIFNDLNEGWTTVSWETVIDRNPDIIVVLDTNWEPAEDRIARLQALPELTSMAAFQDDRFVVVHYQQVVPGLRNVEAVQRLAEGFHPAIFP